MQHFDRSAPNPQPAPASFSSSFLTQNQYPNTPVAFIHDAPPTDDKDPNALFMKGPKRKRLAKACDACHKSKRRCDGTAPCSNCYYATKLCSYTDASGRPVPAPRLGKPDRAELQPPTDSRNPSYNQAQSSHFSSPESSRYSHRMGQGYQTASSSSSSQNIPPGDHSEDERINSRKRFRNDRGNPVAAEDLMIDGPITAVNMDRPAPVELNPALTRELTNLFFTHCHPARAIIHKPTFSADLSHNRVPSYLLHAVCALAAPLSKQPRIRTTPSRFAGKPFAQEALSLMFDGAGRLICEQNLATAQALCLLQMHDGTIKDMHSAWNSRYHDLALAIVEKLGVHSPEHPTLTPVPSPEFIQASLEREAIRRIFWLIHTLDVMASIYFKKPITFTDQDLRLRLPVDETSFELGVHSTLPEYLYLPAVRTQNASEFGHLIRILSIYAKVEVILDELNDPESLINPSATLLEAEKDMDVWANTLPEHLRFSEESLQVQQSMFETSSNTGAWCWCSMHVYHASCALAIHFARLRCSPRGNKQAPQWALSLPNLILNLLGDRAKNSTLMGAALWSLIKYCKRDDAQVHAWSVEYEESFGTKMYELVQDGRPSPPPQLPYPQQQQLAPVQQQQQQQLQQPSSSHRQLSDARNSIANPSHTGARPPPHQRGGDTSYSGRRSPSSSPTSYPLGRSLDELRLHNSNNASSRPLPGDGNTRDARSGSNSVGIGVGPALGHGGNDSQKYSVYNERSEKENGVNGVVGGPIGAANGIGQVNGGAAAAAAPGAASGMNDSSGRSHGIGIGDSPQSLPSLKASGLLDSWPSSRADMPKQQQIHGNNPRSSPRRSPPPNPHDMDARSTTTIGMPVGLQWLANESR